MAGAVSQVTVGCRLGAFAWSHTRASRFFSIYIDDAIIVTISTAEMTPRAYFAMLRTSEDQSSR
jgi:hypothetical protein